METIKIDIDKKFKSMKDFLLYYKKKKWIFRYFKLKILNVDVYFTKKGYHIYIDVKNKLSNQDIIFLQLCLGSDIIRECFYWKRIKGIVLKNKGWNILFKRKYDGNNKLISKEMYSLKYSLKLENLLTH